MRRATRVHRAIGEASASAEKISPVGAGVRDGSHDTRAKATMSLLWEEDSPALMHSRLRDEDADLTTALQALEADDINDSEENIDDRCPDFRRRRRLAADSWPLSETHNLEGRFDGHTAGRQARRLASPLVTTPRVRLPAPFASTARSPPLMFRTATLEQVLSGRPRRRACPSA